jgi:4a-hydroxytetrahydrobiopterin dehydratase
MRDAPLTDEELSVALTSLPRWVVKDGRLATKRDLPTFLAAVAFVQQVAQVAEELDHHPDIDIRWRSVLLAVSTHDSGGAITARDITLAQRVDALPAAS